jgi:hypothetical protein
MLFVAALIATGALMAIAVSALARTGVSGPWLVPVIAVLCHTTAFYLGRRHILPRSLAESPAKSAVTLGVMVVVTLAAAVAGTWAVQWTIGREVATSTLTIVLWFVLLWLAVRRQQQSYGRLGVSGNGARR